MADKCCDSMAKANELHTDNEMFGSLVWEYDGDIYMGCDLPPVKFCPWCGKELASEKRTEEPK